MRKKTIAFFLPYFDIGGIERLYISYANHLTKQYDVSIISCSIEGAYREDIHQDVHVVELSGARIRTSYFKLIKVLRKYQYDYLIGSNMLANLVMLVAKPFCRKTHYIVFIHNYINHEIMHLGVYGRFSLFFMKKLYPKADKVIAVSVGIKEYMVREFKIPRGKAEIVYNAVDVDDIIRKSQIKVCCPQGDFIVYVGRMTVVKNLPFLFNSFDAIESNNLKLLVIGDGPYKEEVKIAALKSKKRDNIIIVGAKANPMPYIKKAKCLVLPSTSESFGLVLLEALCLGKPVVTTPTKGALEVLSSCKDSFISSGFNNPEEFANLIEQACSHQSVDEGRTIRRFSIKSSVNSLIKVLKSLG